MNVRRGLFRLWLAGSSVWVGFVIWNEYKSESSMPPLPQGFVLDYGFQHINFWADALAIPIAAGLLLAFAYWIIGGFLPGRIRQGSISDHPIGVSDQFRD